MVLGHCFLREIAQSGHRLGSIPTVQPGSCMLGIRSSSPSVPYAAVVAARPAPLLGPHFLRSLFLEEVPGFPYKTMVS